MRFTKMHGLGNDYVYVNAFDESVPDPAALAPVVSNRHFGIGADGLILILPSDHADVRMRMFNADGSEAEMCGNGVRCVAKYALDHGLAPGRPLPPGPAADLLTAAMPDHDNLCHLSVETGRGVLDLAAAQRCQSGRDTVELVCVDMGAPILNPGDIPVNITGPRAVGVPLNVLGRNLLLTAVSMGNPHAVFFVPHLAPIDLTAMGSTIETHPLFPNRTNVHFVRVDSPHQVTMITWERGSGITLACGTGAAAVCVAGILASKTQRQIRANLPGGPLDLLWNEPDDHVYMTGPATEVFTGHFPFA